MCIAGSKGQDKEPNSLDPSTSTKARACFYLTGAHHEGACEGGTVVGIEDAAHEDGGHTTASRARARERSRQGGAGDVRARMWLAPRTVCRFLQSLSQPMFIIRHPRHRTGVHTDAVTTSSGTPGPPIITAILDHHSSSKHRTLEMRSRWRAVKQPKKHTQRSQVHKSSLDLT